MRIEQSEACTVPKVLLDQIEQQRAFAGAGLADDVEVPAALVGFEHRQLARGAGADAKRMFVVNHGQKRAGVPCAPQFGNWCW